jgi:hypothetical protein
MEKVIDKIVSITLASITLLPDPAHSLDVDLCCQLPFATLG